MTETTRESVRPLLELQRIDSAIDRLHQRRADLPEQRELDDLNAQRAEVGGQHADKQSELDAVIREQTRRETEIQQLSDKMEHEQSRLYSGAVQNPKELSSIQAELDALRRRKAHLEDEDLEVMEQHELLEKEATDLTTHLADLDAKIADATTRRDAASVEIGHELDQLAAEREKVVPTLPPEIVQTYEDARAKATGGVAVGALEAGVCSACRLPLSPLARDEIRRSEDPLPRCENCRRFLIVV